MTTNLPANLDNVSDEELNKALGITQENNFDSVPRLKINAEAEDDQEKPLPMGTFFISKKDTPKAYSKKVDIRIVTRVFQYQNFDKTTKKMVDQSIMSANLFGEFPSTSGKLKCGKLSKKQAEGATLSKEQTLLQETVKCRMLLFCLVSYTGTTQDGKEVTFTNEPVLFVPSQAAWTTMDEVVKTFEKQKRAAIKYPVSMTLKKEKKGSVTYYVPIPAISNEPVKLEKADGEAITSAGDYIKLNNANVMQKYAQALKGVPTEQDSRSEELANEVGAVVTKKGNKDDLDDEIPF